jgi:hypothetical protein
MGDAHEFLILFIPTLSLLLKKYVHITCSNNICYFYKLSWKKFFQSSLEENLTFAILYIYKIKLLKQIVV